ncbi:hypothetical protein [Acinetobacter sp. GSS19]|uniref:hypothetical protein n=1 Tax=Acinetobacter sp. GSS19 TaxID=3020716 RepID=UPI00235E93A6|nr:hypothetical protein [Acinetobacter sp. GSS19]
MKVIFQGSHPKEIGEEKANEDAFAFSEDHTKLVLCDGATESYNSKLWARLICDSFIENHNLNEDWLKLAIKKYVVEHDFNNMSWSKLSSYQRGSFTTLVSFCLDETRKEIIVRLFGDSFIFFFGEKNGIYEYIPTFDIPDFHSNPNLLSTKMDLNNDIDFSEENSNHYLTLPLDGCYQSIIAICATDALADWFDRAMTVIKHDRLIRIFKKINHQKFNKLVGVCRKRGTLKVDDTTLIIAEIK